MLYGILLDQLHVMIFAKVIHLLLSNKISEESLQLAQKLLTKFCKLTEEYYGYSDYNIVIISSFISLLF